MQTLLPEGSILKEETPPQGLEDLEVFEQTGIDVPAVVLQQQGTQDACLPAEKDKTKTQGIDGHRVVLNDPDAFAQERHFEQVGLLGRATGAHPSRKEINDAVFRAAAVRPRGILPYKDGKFQLTMASEEEKQKVRAAEVKIQGRPVAIWPWTAAGCHQLASLDVACYWVRFPGLPSHLFMSVAKLAAKLGEVVKEPTPREDMVNGITPAVCVQIGDEDPMPTSLHIENQGCRGTEDFGQPLDYADMMYQCDSCGMAGHHHPVCKNPQKTGSGAWLNMVNARDKGAVKAAPRSQGQKRQPGRSAPAKLVTHKVALVLQRKKEGAPELWISLEDNRRSFPMKRVPEDQKAGLEGEKEWDAVRDVLRILLQPVC